MPVNGLFAFWKLMIGGMTTLEGGSQQESVAIS
jgi:hypothetical protein